MADGHPDDDAEWDAARDFISAHGQSFDWILSGNPGGMICHGAASAMLLPQSDVDDPIFGAIEAHKTVSAALEAAVHTHSDLETELPKEKRRSTVDIWDGEKIVETDDPRWIDSERESMGMWDAQDDAAAALVSVQPTTRAGTLALLQYAVAADVDGETWPRELEPDDGGRTRSWHQLLIENVAAALTQGH